MILIVCYHNYLYDKYIKNFTILDKYTHKLVSKYDNTPLLCEHYCLQCKTDTDPNMFDILKEEFGDEKNDGIYCKYCCELLYDVEMSNFLGFDGNVPIINKTIVETKNYTYDDINLKDFIISLSKNLISITFILILSDIFFKLKLLTKGNPSFPKILLDLKKAI